MLNKALLSALLVAVTSLSSCSLIRSDTRSNDPAVASQAQQVESSKRQVRDQERYVSDAKTRLNAEKSKLKVLKSQLRSEEQALKTVKLRSVR